MTVAETEHMSIYLRTFLRLLSSWGAQAADQRKHIDVVYGGRQTWDVIRCDPSQTLRRRSLATGYCSSVSALGSLRSPAYPGAKEHS